MQSRQLRQSHFMKSIVYGGVDGIITTFAIVASASGASLSPSVLMILGFASLFADALSMGFGDYLSWRAAHEVHGQKSHQVHYHNHILAIKSGAYTFLSFLLFGSVPLLTYVLAPCSEFIRMNRFVTACILTAITLFVLGAAKTKMTKKHWMYSGLEMLSIGGLCAFAAYFIGHVLAGFIQ